jgi:hypothetical protein
MLLADQLKQQAKAMVGQPYTCNNRHIACILLVLELVAPYSVELQGILGRLRCMEITHNKKTLIEQDYFRKFINTTRLEWVNELRDITPGDILLINGYSQGNKIDHLGLYLGDGEYVHLHRDRRFARQDVVELGRVDDDRRRILGIVRAKDYGTTGSRLQGRDGVQDS